MNDYAGHTAEALRALCAGATEPPWDVAPMGLRIHEDGVIIEAIGAEIHPYADVIARIGVIGRRRTAAQVLADAKFIEAARLALPAALDRVAALEAENARLREALGQYADRSNWVFRDSSHGPGGVHRDLWTYYEHGYERAWKALQPETRAALGEARDGD